MSWDQIGYSEYLTREENLISSSQELDPLAFDNFAPELSGSKLTGLIQSQDGRVKLDLDNNSLIISNGVVESVRLGKLDDGTYGLQIQDKNGNLLMRIGDRNFIQSPTGAFKADFDAENITASENGTPLALFGRQDNGFG